MNKLLCFLLLISSTIFGQNNMSYSLLEAQDFALKNHLSIKNSALAIEKSEEQKKEYLAIVCHKYQQIADLIISLIYPFK